MAHSWQAIQAGFMQRITEREWAPGDLIPSESELASELGCSRVTVNRALRDLAERGLLDRKRKAGTRVVQNPERKATFVIPVIRLEVEAGGAVYQHQLLEVKNKKCTAAVEQRMGLEQGSKALYVRTLHKADDQPFAFEERWINREAVPALQPEVLQEVSANEWLVNNAPFTRGDLSLGAQQADADIAKLMQCELGDALLAIERSTWSGKQCITFVRLIYAPSYQLRTVL